MLVRPVLGKIDTEDREFKSSLGYVEPHLRKKKMILGNSSLFHLLLTSYVILGRVLAFLAL